MLSVKNITVLISKHVKLILWGCRIARNRSPISLYHRMTYKLKEGGSYRSTGRKRMEATDVSESAHMAEC
jgi:hypothetical protein